MNEQKHTIGASINTDPWATRDGELTIFNAMIDGIESGDYLVIDNFFKSVENEGLYYILQGGCHISGCCGDFVEVRHENDSIIWNKSYRCLDEGEVDLETEVKKLTLVGDKVMEFPIVFDRVQYELLARKLVEISNYTTNVI